MQPMLLEKRSAAGEAMKMEEYVPIRIPAEIVQAKSSMEGAAKEVQTNQYGERGKRGQQGTESVWLMASFMICSALSFGSA